MSAIQAAAQAATKYFRDSYHEMRYVVWPNKRQVIVHTILVIVFSALIALLLGSLDILFAFILGKVLTR